ncbi:YEATS domain-containing protein 2 isoform X2 [Anoplophora glabripennis]|uniref:YEATS domain-containing protein 2 isoform X2 n=1 Tax=Anoplophora glabripennis TaxID=217634 RepID=UPI000873B4D5|nr:YEATS domain-containing protein 2 isoform X2 [Anoplophora glabripennis]
MEPNRDFANVDPDYEKYNLALKEIEKESEENELTSERLHSIIAVEFDKELTFRQQQLEEIEDKIFKAQKLLHLVRYVLVSSYYNKRNLEYASTNESPSTSNFDSQSRIHPAVKKLLGNNSLEALAARGKRKVHNKNNESNEALEEPSQPVHVKKIKLRETVTDSIKCNNVESVQNSLKRKKTKHRILVGNISKWMPSLENDNTTHKWMVYVRGSKEAPDLSHLIEKVVFYLHPSYKPHDVVEVSEYPFHLSRRGWGEFPLRVQIFFKCTLNKPVSIVHNLKLDKTYTGRQTLVEPPENQPDEEKYIETDNKVIIENTLMDVKEELPTTSADLEHNYCHDKKIKVEEDVDVNVSVSETSLLDHSYSLPYKDCDDLSQSDRVKEEKSDSSGEQGNNLIFGLDETYRDERRKTEADISKDKCVVRTFTTATGQPIKVLPQSFNKVILSNGNIVQIKLLKTPPPLVKEIDPAPVLEKLSNTKVDRIDFEKYKVKFPKQQFKNVGEVLPYLFKRLPLWSEQANNPSFKCVYPYMASSEAEFSSWNIGKQLSCEWSRARTVKKILCSERFEGSERWSTKSFFMYGRSHGYSPMRSGGVLFNKPSKELELLMTCFCDSPQKPLPPNCSSDDVHVDVVHENDSTLASKDGDTIDISDSSLRHHCTFVKEAALDCGVVLKPEEIAEGVTWNGAERMILESVRCLADHLIRRGRLHMISQERESETSEIGVNEIKIAMSERSEIKVITEYQKKRLVKDFFS